MTQGSTTTGLSLSSSGFAEGAVAVEAVPDDDTVSVHAATGVLDAWAERESVRLAADPPRSVLSRWAWLLTNRRATWMGFPD